MRYEELNLIGCILSSSEPYEIVNQIYGRLKAEMFTCEDTRSVYENVVSMFEENADINIATITNRMASDSEKKGELISFFGECVSAVGISYEYVGYAELIASEYKAKRINEIVTRQGTFSEINDDVDRMITELSELREDVKSDIRSLADIVDVEKEKHFKPKGNDDLKLGFLDIDDAVTIENGDVCVIGARPGVGKSAIALQFAINFCKQGKRVAYFNLEMSDTQIYQRMFVHESKEITLSRLRKAEYFLGNEAEDYRDTNEKLHKIEIMISTGSKTVGQIMQIARGGGYDVIIIDYLQLIRSDKSYNGNRAAEVGAISKSIKAIATDLGLSIILLSQMNRASEMKPDAEPEVSELRESGDIEQDASVIFLVWNLERDDPKHTFKGFKCGKNRQGELIDRALLFDGSHMRFEEIHGVTSCMKQNELKDRARKTAVSNSEMSNVSNEEEVIRGKQKFAEKRRKMMEEGSDMPFTTPY